VLSGLGKKLPPAPGTVDQQLTSLSLAREGGDLHNELDIPPAPDTPYALQLMLDVVRNQYLAFIEKMKDPQLPEQLRLQILEEKVSVNGFEPTFDSWEASSKSGHWLMLASRK